MSLKYIACSPNITKDPTKPNSRYRIFKYVPNKPHIAVSADNVRKIRDKLSLDIKSFRGAMDDEVKDTLCEIEAKIKALSDQKEKIYVNIANAENEEMERLLSVFPEENPEYLI